VLGILDYEVDRLTQGLVVLHVVDQSEMLLNQGVLAAIQTYSGEKKNSYVYLTLSTLNITQ